MSATTPPRTTTLRADLMLLHAPSVFDFRERDDTLFAYLSDSDSVNVTSVYEMYPLGLLSIQQRLREHGLETKIVNVASLMLQHPALDVDRLLARLEAPVFGIDLHWMAHCHGAIELARRVKAIHPDALLILGGLSATYYARELIEYAPVDVVVRGYDTLLPVTQLVEAAMRGGRDFRHVPNLLYKSTDNEIRDTGFSHRPVGGYNDAAVDWSFYRDARSHTVTSRLIMTLPNTGCALDCPWCGGSRFAYGHIMGLKKTLVQKDHAHVVKELRSMGDAARTTSIYALQCYSEPKERFYEYLDVVAEMGYRSVSFELFQLPEQETLERMAAATRAFVMLSPESHDPTVSRLAGRGHYTMAQMEEWIPRALDTGVAGVMVWFFIGMPRQDRQSVRDTVAYCESLLRKFPGRNVLPLLCPMVPFLDPGSRFFEQPQRHGYRLFHRTLEEHRRAMVAPLWYQRLNYETDWLSRREIQDVTYEAVGRLVDVKAELGVMPASVAKTVRATIAETQALLADMERALEADGALPEQVRNRMRDYNRKILAYSSDQIIPAKRPFGGRWFDDYTVPRAMIAACCEPGRYPAPLGG